MKIVDRGRNTTIPYGQDVRPYHRVVARLVAKYATDRHRLLLDYGCGVGNTLVAIRSLRLPLRFAIADLDANCLRLTREKVDVEREIMLDDPRALLELDDEFDIVVLSHTLQYDPEPRRTVAKLLSMLRPGGYLFLASPNPSTPTKILYHLFRRYYSEGLYTWDRSTMRNFLACFPKSTLVEMTHDYLPLPLLNRRQRLMPFLERLAAIAPWLAFSVIAVVRKDH